MKTESGTWTTRTKTQWRKHGIDDGIEKTRQLEEREKSWTKTNQAW
jgi:hypothetical protein